MAAKGYDLGHESGMNRGEDFLLTERHTARMGEKACNHAGQLQAAAPLHLEQALRAMWNYEAERVDPQSRQRFGQWSKVAA